MIATTINKHNIEMNGFKSSKDKSDPILSYENIRRCMKEIPELYERATKYSKILPDSYGMKHEIEELRDDGYISNGELIVAMILCNYKCKKLGKNGIFMYKKIK
jgi:hypothetical protein